MTEVSLVDVYSCINILGLEAVCHRILGIKFGILMGRRIFKYILLLNESLRKPIT